MIVHKKTVQQFKKLISISALFSDMKRKNKLWPRKNKHSWSKTNLDPLISRFWNISRDFGWPKNVWYLHGARTSNITADPRIATTDSDCASLSKSMGNPSDW